MSWADRADRMLGVAIRTFRHADGDGVSLVQYFPKIGESYFIDAVFDRSHVEVDPQTGAPISSTNPTLGVRHSKLQAEPRKGDRVRVGNVDYLVDDWQPDGVAGGTMILRKP